MESWCLQTRVMTEMSELEGRASHSSSSSELGKALNKTSMSFVFFYLKLQLRGDSLVLQTSAEVLLDLCFGSMFSCWRTSP